MRIRRLSALLAGAVALIALYPALAQRSPESILPPGFGDPAAPPPANASAPRPPAVPVPEPGNEAIAESEGNTISDELGNALENEVAAAEPVDLPPQARRSLDRVGLMLPGDGGMAADAFGNTDGQFLSTLMRRIDAPIASRWASILLRRALLSQSETPAGIGGADWVADRAWLLVRMGEADNARALVQRVDSDNYTSWLSDTAMQAALAAADPAALCPIADAAAAQSDKASWALVQAMCAGLSGESGTASASIDRARRQGRAGGIDVLLAEKVVGAGTNTRRAVNIQWDGVDRLTSWRYGLAAATGVAIPRQLFGTVGPQVQAWAARAPLTDAALRAGWADRAATLGVFSNAALVDLYGSIYDAADPDDRGGSIAAALRNAYLDDPSARVSAMRGLWDAKGNQHYARLILTARAAAMLAPGAVSDADDVGALIESMMSAGFDTQAARWAGSTASGSAGWAVLAVGSPRAPFAIGASAVGDYPDDALRTRFLLAGLAGLGRLSASDAGRLSGSLNAGLNIQNSWTRALDRAVAAREQGTVALLCAAGMQTSNWAYVPPAYLYRIVSSLRRVGLEPEARMIAAEALTRS